MRFACRINLLLFFVGAAVASAQINPATQIRWPNNCTGGNLFYDIVHNTCTAGTSGSVVLTVNGNPVTNPNFNDTTPTPPGSNQAVHFQTDGGNVSAYVLPGGGGGGGGIAAPAPPNGSYQFNNNNSLGGNAYVLDVSSFPGTTWDAKVNACFNALYAAGGGTCDARSLSGSQTMSSSVTVGNGAVATVLLMGAMTLNRATGTQILVNTYGQLIGMGKNNTVIAGDTKIPAVQQAYGSIKDTKWEHFGVSGSGAVTPGVAGIQFGGPNSGIPMPNWPGTASQNGALGSAGWGDFYSWPGYITQFAVYNHALTTAQISNHYTVGTTGTGYESVVLGDSPVAYFPLKETTGTIATDIVAGRNGTYMNGVTLASANGIHGDNSCGGVCKMPLFAGQNSNQFVSLPSFSWITSTDWSVEAWFQPNIPDGTWKRLWGFADGSGTNISLTQNSSNAGLQISSSYSPILYQGQVGFDSGVMHHIVIVHVSTPVPGLLFYQDGYLIRIGSDIIQSFLNDVASGGFDIGLQLKSEAGCICYNEISDVSVAGNTYGLDTENVSGYTFGVNSNTFTNGNYGGNIGIHTAGGVLNTFIKPDMEGDTGASYDLEDGEVYMMSPYEEASGPPILNGFGHFVTGFGGYHYGACTTCTYLSVNYMPDYWAAGTGYLFGRTNHPDSGTGTTAAFLGPTGNPFDGIDLVQMGNSVNTYGKAGHAPLKVGPMFSYGGLRSSGSSYVLATGAPPAPTATAVGGTGTTYTYFAVGYGIWGEPTIPSGPVTVSGPATLDSSHYITILPPRGVDGIWCWDILKGDTSHVLTFDGTNHCGNLNAYVGINDQGQATVPYTPATRDATGDLRVQGWVRGGAFGIDGCAPGTYLKADYSGCANPVTGAVSNTTLTVGTTAIPAGLPCAGPYTISMPGTTTLMTIKITPSTDISGVTGWGPVGGGGLYFVQWPTADTMNYKICNASTASITPSSSTTWNVSVQ